MVLLWMSVPLSLAQSRADVEELIRTASRTLEKSIKETYQGRGTAKVLIHREEIPSAEIAINYDTGETTIIKPRGTKIETTEQKFLIDFTFKGETSMAKRYGIKDNGERGGLLSATINTPEISFHYDGKENYAVQAPTESFQSYYRELGYDFHPETQIKFFPKASFQEIIDGLIKYAREINVTSTKEGLLQIEFKGSKIEESHASSFLLLNPQADFRPVEYKEEAEVFSRSGSGIEKTNYQAKWKQYSLTWYITELKSEESYEWKSKPPTKYRVGVEVLNFDPDTEVEDSRFDFENLDIPKGTPVYDRIENIEYKWGEEEKVDTGLLEGQTEKISVSQK